MDDVVSYDELQAMTPAERSEHFEASIVRDLDALTERQRARLEAQTARVLAREERLRGSAL